MPTAPPTSTWLRTVLRPRGRLFVLYFSDRQPGRDGKSHKLTRQTQPITPPPGQTLDPPPPPVRATAARRRHLSTAALVAIAALVIAVHLRLGEALLASSLRAGWVVGGILVVVVVKVLIVGRYALHRRRPSQGNENRR
ncbi:hypothetical protein [Actinomadura sp. HBU206391]|uniref:hypothetical protein n=1 Tax=Actinomadura sp. HBU206391 TaxID=2731692 RepID=UPI0021C68C25|nr:hypothetical protein [Actinomadura sp. HBU206391]